MHNLYRGLQCNPSCCARGNTRAASLCMLMRERRRMTEWGRPGAMENLLIQHLQWEGREIWGLSLTKDMWRRSAVKGREKREGPAQVDGSSLMRRGSQPEQLKGWHQPVSCSAKRLQSCMAHEWERGAGVSSLQWLRTAGSSRHELTYCTHTLIMHCLLYLKPLKCKCNPG